LPLRLSVEEFGYLRQPFATPLQALDPIESLEDFVAKEPPAGRSAIHLMEQPHEAVVVDRLAG
jgi:hypothetical protein